MPEGHSAGHSGESWGRYVVSLIMGNAGDAGYLGVYVGTLLCGFYVGTLVTCKLIHQGLCGDRV